MRNTVNGSIANIVSVTPLQEGMIYHFLMNPKSTNYVVQSVFNVQGELDVEKVNAAVELLIRRHGALRTAIVCNKVSRPLQVILKTRSADFEYYDYKESDIDYKKLLSDEVKRGFDLQKDSLIRIRCVRTEEKEYKLVFTYHHVIMDGWCTSIILGDFLRYYSDLINGTTQEEMEVRIDRELEGNSSTYLDFIDWLENSPKEEGYKYWNRVLEGYDHAVDVPGLGIAKPCEEESKRLGINVSIETAAKIKELGAKYQVTDNTIFETAWGIALQSLHYIDDVVFGKVTSGRNVPVKDAQSIVGMFINTIPVRVTRTKETTVAQLLQNMQNQSEETSSYEHCSLAEIQSNSYIKNGLVNTLFVYENYFVDGERMDVELPFTITTEAAREQTSYPFNMIAYNTQDGYRIEVMFDPSVYTDSEADSILVKMHTILEQMAAEPEKKVSDIVTADKEEIEKVKEIFNKTSATYEGAENSIGNLLNIRAEKNPEKTALVFGNQKMTYQELKQRVDSLGNKLREEGIGQGDAVAIIAKRSMEMILAIYAVQTIGAAYVPIDPENPKDRVAFIIHDAKPKAVCTYQAKLSLDDSQKVKIFDLADEALYEGTEKLESVDNKERAASYIYTSGTTGNPKGVMNTEKGLLNTLFWMKETYQLGEDENFLLKTNYTFDVSETEIFLFAATGGTLVIAEPGMEKDPMGLAEIIYQNKVTMVNFVPSMLNSFLATMEANQGSLKNLSSLRMVCAAGEALEMDTVKQFYQLLEGVADGIQLVNAYGPTEASIYATACVCHKDDRKVYIGKPVGNAQIYIIADNGLCGINTLGELCIGGAGVAKGYVNLPELTEERFTQNPYGEGVLYHTGDLARWLLDGTIEYCGRMDQQVKIRGFRIELGEIESHIRAFDSVTNCAVVMAKDSMEEDCICAYLEAEGKIDPKAIEDGLKQVLPSYMIPSYIMQIEKLPLNQNGKLDRKALPAPVAVRRNEYTAPRTKMEETLCKIFANVLGLTQVGIRDDFFELGGHSLRVTRLVNQIETETGIAVGLRNVFIDRTVEALARRMESLQRESYEPIPTAEPKEYYPMSSVQKRIYLVSQMDEKGILYNMAQGIELSGQVEKEDLEHALSQMIARHEILRTAFIMIDGDPVQKILENGKTDFTYTEDSTSTKEELLHAFIKPFDLASGCLVRMQLVKREKNYLLMFDLHHIVTDGMSTGRFIKEFMALYNKETLADDIRQYKDYSEWMRTKELSIQRNYWLHEFEGKIPVLELPLDKKRPSERSYHGTMVHQSSTKELALQIRKLARESGTTEYMILLAGLMVTLGKYSGQEDIIIGSPVSGRTHPDTEKMLGMFVNTLALRGKPEKDKTFASFLKEMKNTCLKAYENQDYPFEELIEQIDIKEDMSRNPLFDVMFVLQNNEGVDFKLMQSEVAGTVVESTVAKFDLTFNMVEANGTYHIDLEYCTDIFKEESMNWMLTHYLNILSQAVADPDKKIEELDAITVDEKAQILDQFNTKTELGNERTITEILLEQAEKNKDAIAVIDKESKLTYEEFVRHAGLVAEKLKAAGVGRGDSVLLLTERSTSMIVAVFGTLLAGAAYVPVDISYPEERIRYIQNDCGAKVAVTYHTSFKPQGIPCIDLADITWMDEVEISNVNQPENLAYIIYTSGSTGKPKGVMIEHGGVANLASYMTNDLSISTEDRILMFANYVFDGSVWEMMMAFANGAALVVPSEEIIRDEKQMESFLEKNGVTISYFPPAYFRQNSFQLSKYVVTAGSKSSKDVVEKAVKSCDYINSYGPTEVTVCATNWECKKGASVPDTIPIGKPIRNKRVYIMDGDHLCGMFMPGEICVGGKGIARGYLNEPELTEQLFGWDIYTGTRLYRTGDMGRWLPDGTIEYLGRADEQVKIHGYRIEAGEIEKAVKDIEHISDCVAVVKEDKDEEKYICAYYCADTKIKVEEVRNGLEKVLPEYMIPARMMQIENMPMTRNGKVDKEALPEITETFKVEYVAPRTPEEKAVCDCITQALEIPIVGVYTNFFEQGGDSIKAMRVVSKMRDLGYEIAVKDIMQGKTAYKIALEAKKVNSGGVDQREVIGPVVNTPMLQEFFEWKLAKPWHFNQSIMLPVPDDTEKIRMALDELVKHHDILRSVCRDEHLIIQSFRRSKKYDFVELELEDGHDLLERVDAECTKVQESINLQEGPLMKAVFMRIGAECYLMLTVHHLVVDTASWGILAEDFKTALGQLENGETVSLPDKTTSFKQWSKLLIEYKDTEVLPKQKDYWQGVSQRVKEGRLQLTNKEPAEGTGNTTIFLKKADTDRLLYNTGNAFGTYTNELMLAAFGIAVKQLTNQKCVAINLEKHGREDIGKGADVTRTVGWFTCTSPIIIECEENLREEIVKTKDMMRNIPDGGIGFGLVKEELSLQYADIYFNYIGSVDTDTDTSKSIYERTGKNSALENKLPGSLNFIARETNGLMQIDFIFDESLYQKEDIQKFAKLYKESLINCIDYCADQKENVLTKTDVFAELEGSDIDLINSLLED